MPLVMHSERSAWSLRLFLVCFMALSVSFPVAWISIAKGFVFAYGLVYLLSSAWTKRDVVLSPRLWTTAIILILMIAFALSLFWTEADLQSALTAFIRHGKLMDIVLLVTLIRTAQEARIAISVYAAGQAFLLVSSWMMFAGIPIPWSMDAPTPYIVFSSYLDQSIMFATTAGVAWHLRNEKLWSPGIGMTFAVLALVNALILLEGRSGYIIALTSLSLAVMWSMPRRWRIATLMVTPALFSALLLIGSDQVQERVTKIFGEVKNYASTQQVGARDSSAFRLNAWYRSAQAIQEAPVLGHGVGAWTPTVKRFQGDSATRIFGKGNLSNPHQEFLLWGVELGVVGLSLLVALMLSIGKDALRLPTNIRRAALSVLIAMAVACLFNSALYDDLLGDFFCVSVGLLLALGVRTAQSSVRAPSSAVHQPKAQSLA